MARTAITATRLTAATEVNAVSQAIDATNGHVVSLPTSDALGQSKGKVNLLVLRFVNTFAGAKSVTIKANAGPTAGTDYYAPFHQQASKGDLTFSLAQNEVSYIAGLGAMVGVDSACSRHISVSDCSAEDSADMVSCTSRTEYLKRQRDIRSPT
jgi:hypothetical protein